VLFQLF